MSKNSQDANTKDSPSRPVAPLPPQLIDQLHTKLWDFFEPDPNEKYLNDLETDILAILTSEIEKAATAARIDELESLLRIYDEHVKASVKLDMRERIDRLKATLNQKGETDGQS